MPITTPGAIQIKHMLPTKEARDRFDLYTPLDKKGISKLINLLVQHGGENAHTTINDLAKLFFNKATETGATTPLSDYDNDSSEKQALISEFETKVSEVLSKNLSKQERNIELNKLAGHYSGLLSKQNLSYMLSRSSVAAKMALSGARGNPMQLNQGTGSPLLAADVKGNPIPVAIKHSYAEGLSSSEHMAASYGGRASTVLSQLSTEKPGALFKSLTPAVFHEVITESDCGTKNGIPIPLSDKLSCIGRFEAKTNRLIDEKYYDELKSSTRTSVVARSPLTCRAKNGLCQKCYGLAATGRLPNIGQNMGVIASQSVSEVLTQAMLSTKHQGGVAGRQRNPYEEANNILSNPENFQDEAVISQVNGQVNSIEQTSLKDWEVTIGTTKHFVPNIQSPIVKLGDNVRVGDQISTGTINPRELTELKGSGAGRVYLSNEMRKIYSRNAQLDPRHFDVIARNMMKYNQVVDPGESEFLPGDKIEVGQLEDYFYQHKKAVPVSQAVGKVLASSTLDLTPGTVLSQNHLDDLEKQGLTQVDISTSNLVTKPVVPGLQNLKLLDKNWISKLSFNRLPKSISEAAALGLSSPKHSTEPVTSYILGTEFGEGEKGKY